jgi:polygalacturonase/rhamnogalacturonyl hydrolase YesR
MEIISKTSRKSGLNLNFSVKRPRIYLLFSIPLLLTFNLIAQNPQELATRIADLLITETRFQFDTLPMKRVQERTLILDFTQLPDFKKKRLGLAQFNLKMPSHFTKEIQLGISADEGLCVIFQGGKEIFRQNIIAKNQATVVRKDYELILFSQYTPLSISDTLTPFYVYFKPKNPKNGRIYLGFSEKENRMLPTDINIEKIMGTTALKHKSFASVKDIPINTSFTSFPTPSVSAFTEPSNHNDWRYYWGVNLTALHDVSRQFSKPNYQQHITRCVDFFVKNKDKIAAERNQYGLLDGAFSHYFRGAMLDDLGMQAVAIQLSDIEEKTKNNLVNALLEKLKSRIPTLPDGTLVRLVPDSFTVQSDDAMMGGNALLRLGSAQKNPTRIAEAALQSLNFHKYLFDEKTGLYRHAFSTKTQQQSCCAWARGMGWVMVFNAELLKNNPPNAAQITTNFKATCAALLKYQNANGGFHQVLTDPNTYLETSATAMFVTAFAEGVNLGILDKTQFESAILRGYRFVESKVKPTGEIEDIVRGTPILPTADAYNKQRKILNDPRGIGAVLWMCTAMDRFQKNNPPLDWSAVPNLLKRIVPPTFSTRIFTVNTTGDFRQNCQMAIDQCHAAGGGKVVVPTGKWSCKGPIVLKSNVLLEITEGVSIHFSTDPKDYLPNVLVRWEGTVCYNYSPLIYANGQKNIGITGKGTLDGGATLANWGAWKKLQDPAKKLLRQMGNDQTPDSTRQFGEGHFLRPSLIEFQSCEQILLEDFTIKQSPFWTIHPVFSKNITIRKLNVQHGTSNDDGIDPDSCTDVLIEDCTIDTDDDPIAIKAGRDQDAWQRPNTENIIIRRCRVSSKVGNGFCIGSEMSGGVKSVFVEDYFISKTDNGINFKCNLDRGGYIKDTHLRNIKIDTCTRNGILFQMDYHSWRGNNFPPDFSHFSLQNIDIQSVAKTGIAIRGVATKPIRDVELKNVNVKQAGQMRDVQYTEGVIFVEK